MILARHARVGAPVSQTNGRHRCWTDRDHLDSRSGHGVGGLVGILILTSCPDRTQDSDKLCRKQILIFTDKPFTSQIHKTNHYTNVNQNIIRKHQTQFPFSITLVNKQTKLRLEMLISPAILPNFSIPFLKKKKNMYI